MDINFRKIFLISLIIALSISALIGIYIFLAGNFGDTESKLLLTTLSVGGYSLTGLCSATIQKQNNLKWFSILGMLISTTGFLITIGTIWEFFDFYDIWKTLIIFIILPITFAHISLLLQIKPKTTYAKLSLVWTIIFISIVALMLVTSTLTEFRESETFYRLLGVFSILDVLGTIVTPIFNRIPVKKD